MASSHIERQEKVRELFPGFVPCIEVKELLVFMAFLRKVEQEKGQKGLASTESL